MRRRPTETTRCGEVSAGDVTVAQLTVAARELGLPALGASVTRALREALPFPADDARYATNALVPGRPPLELSFVDGDSAELRFDFEPAGPASSPARRREHAVAIVRRWAAEMATTAARAQLAEALSPLADVPLGPDATFGAFVGAACDADGLSQAKLYIELGGTLPLVCPAPLADVASACGTRVPQLVPHLMSLACGRHRCVPRLYLMCADDLPLGALQHALAAAGLEHRHADLVARAAALFGGMGVLRAGGAVLSFSIDDGRQSCKLDVLARALPLSQAALAQRIGHVVAEYPGLRAALYRWSRAHGGIGIAPGEITVAGWRVGLAGPARLELYVSPAEWSVACAW